MEKYDKTAVSRRACVQRTGGFAAGETLLHDAAAVGAPSGNCAVRCELYDAVGTSNIIYPRRGRALREAPSREASRRRKPKFNLRRDAHTELARRAVERRGPETADARSCDVARRAARAARRGTAPSVNKSHFYIGPENPPATRAPTRRRAVPTPRADLRNEAHRRPVSSGRSLSRFEGRQEPGASPEARVTRTRC